MKPPSEDHSLIRWLDGEMNDTERAAFEQRLKHDPALAKEARELRALSSGIHTHLPAEMEVPHADFFNSQIQVRLAQMESDESGSRRPASPGWATLLRWLRQPWLAASGAVALAVVSLVLFRPAPDASESFILSSYTPNAEIHARVFYDDAAAATVLMLEGLDAVPAKRTVSGISVQRSDAEPQFAATTLDPASVPMLWTNTPRG